MAKNEAGYSLVELIIVVIFLGVFAAVAVPRLNFAIVSKQKADTIARKIVTDLRRTRSLAISDAANNTEGYELKMVGAAPYIGYEIENADTGETVDSHTIDSSVSCTGDNTFEFGPLGNLKTGSGSELTVSAEGKSYTINIVPATGAAKCVGN
jgi:Tfp pilus assembly protein FimT